MSIRQDELIMRDVEGRRYERYDYDDGRGSALRHADSPDYEDEHRPKRRRKESLTPPPPPPPPPSSVGPTTLRLIAKASSRSSLPPEQTLALCDPSTTVAIGRDRAFDLRIRLKEMPVSKTHCTLFWLPGTAREAGSWAVVDCGSQHGTFIQREGSAEWQRASEPKVASTPIRFGHMDRIKICSTTFTAHVHPACAVCAIAVDNSNLIPLQAKPQDATSAADKPGAPSLQASTRADREDAMKRDFKSLKAQLLAKPHSKTPKQAVEAPKASYIDRAKIRRSMHGSSVPVPPPSYAAPPPPAYTRPSPAQRTPIPPPPIENSRGYALLSKLSGPLPDRLAAPVEARTLGDRAGLGSREAMDTESYAARHARPDAGLSKRRRWDEAR